MLAPCLLAEISADQMGGLALLVLLVVGPFAYGAYCWIRYGDNPWKHDPDRDIIEDVWPSR